jgi:cytochrome c-type biogenesis protein CcmE
MKLGHWKIVLSLGLIGVLVAFGVTAFQGSLTPYRSFREARAGGYVQVNGTLADPASTSTEQGVLRFQLRDTAGEVLPVTYPGVKPANFEQATSVVAIGQYKNGVFEADQLLVKCPSKYQAEGGEGYLDAKDAPPAAGARPPGGV